MRAHRVVCCLQEDCHRSHRAGRVDDRRVDSIAFLAGALGAEVTRWGENDIIRHGKIALMRSWNHTEAAITSINVSELEGAHQQATQQRMFMLLPAFSLIYGAILPAGLFIYWITTTVFSIVQQFLINGYGGLFPLFGWTPGFAMDYQPRFPVSLPEPKPATTTDGDGKSTQTTKRSTKESAAGTIRPARRRSRRRGRRR